MVKNVRLRKIVRAKLRNRMKRKIKKRKIVRWWN